MNILIILLSYISYLGNNINLHKVNNEYKGFDYRYPLNETLDTLEYRHNFLRKFLIINLEDKQKNDQTKLKIIESYKDFLPEFDSSMAPNISEGGLVDDWNFNI